MQPQTQALTNEDQLQLQACREWVEAQIAPGYLQGTDASLPDPGDAVSSRLSLLRALLSQINADWEPDKLVAMGVVLGDALAEYLRLDWCVVEDEHGRARALHAVGTPIVLFPEPMIVKRVQAGEAVDVFELFSGIAVQVEAYRRQHGESE